MRKTQHFVGKILPFSVAGLLLFAVSMFGVLANPPETVYADGDPHTVTLAYDEESNGSMSFDAAAGGEDPAVKSMQFKAGEKVAVTFVPNDGYYAMTPDVSYLGVVEDTDEYQTIGQVPVVLDEGSAIENHIVFTMPDADTNVSVEFMAGTTEIDVNPETIVPNSSEVIQSALNIPDKEMSITDNIANFFGAEVDTSPLKDTGFVVNLAQTFVSPDGLPEGISIEEFNANDELNLSNYIATTRSTLPLYEVEEDSDYYYAYASGEIANGANVLDWVAAFDDTHGRVLTDKALSFDSTTGIIKVNKLLYADGYYYTDPVVQVLIPMQFDYESTVSTVGVTIESNRAGVTPISDAFTIDVPSFDQMMRIPVLSADVSSEITLDDLEITFDSSSEPIDISSLSEENMIQYDQNTGELFIVGSGTQFGSIDIKIKSEPIESTILNLLFPTKKAIADSKATSADQMLAINAGEPFPNATVNDFKTKWGNVRQVYQAPMAQQSCYTHRASNRGQGWPARLAECEELNWKDPYGSSDKGQCDGVFGPWSRFSGTMNNTRAAAGSYCAMYNEGAHGQAGRVLYAASSAAGASSGALYEGMYKGSVTDLAAAITACGQAGLVREDNRAFGEPGVDDGEGGNYGASAILCVFFTPGWGNASANPTGRFVGGVDFTGCGSALAGVCTEVDVDCNGAIYGSQYTEKEYLKSSTGAPSIPIACSNGHVYCRLLATGKDSVVIGFCAMGFAAQNGCGIYKFEVGASTPIKIQKVDANNSQLNVRVGFKIMVGSYASGDPKDCKLDQYVGPEGEIKPGDIYQATTYWCNYGVTDEILVPLDTQITIIELGRNGEVGGDAPEGYLFSADANGKRTHFVTTTPATGTDVITYSIKNPSPPKVKINKEFLDGLSIPSGYEAYYGKLSDATYKLYVDSDQNAGDEATFSDDAAFRARLKKGVKGPASPTGKEPQWGLPAEATEFKVNVDEVYVCYPNMPGDRYSWTREDWFKGWYIVEEINVPKGMLPPHDSNGQQIHYRFQVQNSEYSPTSVLEYVIKNDLLRPVEITKTGELSPEGQALGFTLEGAKIRVFMDEVQSAASGGTHKLYGALGKLNGPGAEAKGVKDIMSLDAGSYSQLNFEDLASFFATTRLGTIADELQMIDMNYSTNGEMVLTSGQGGRFPVFFVPPADYFPGYKGYLDMEEVHAPNGFEIPFRWVGNNIEVLYPQIDSPISATPAAVIKDNLANYDIPYWLSSKNVMDRYRTVGFDDAGNPIDPCYGEYKGAKFRILVDAHQGRDTIKTVDGWECGTPNFGLAVSNNRSKTLTTNLAEAFEFDTTNLPEKWFMPAAGEQAPKVDGKPFDGWYVIDEIMTPKGFTWPHDLDGNKVYPRFQVTDGNSQVQLEFFNEPHPSYQIEKTYDEGYENILDDNDNAYEKTMAGAEFEIYADPSQDSYGLDRWNGPIQGDVQSANHSKTVKTSSGRDVLVTTSSASDFAVALMDPTSGAMTNVKAGGSAAKIKIDNQGMSQYGSIDHFHLLPAFSPDYDNYTNDIKTHGAKTDWAPYGGSASNTWTWPKASDGRFYGWYVLNEVTTPKGFMIPHDFDGNKLYPRFLVATGGWPVEESKLEVPEDITGYESIFVVADQPIMPGELNKTTEDSYEDMISGKNNPDTASGENHYSSNLSGAQFVIYADPSQDAIEFENIEKDSVSPSGWKTEANGSVSITGDASFNTESIKKAANSKTVMTPSGHQVLTTKTSSGFKLALSDVKTGAMSESNKTTITIDENGKASFHLYPAFSPDSENVDSGVDWTWPKASDGRFYGWYVLDETTAPKGFMLPHDMDGNKLYPRFLMAASSHYDADTARKALVNPEDVTGYNPTITVFNQPLLTEDLTKTYDNSFENLVKDDEHYTTTGEGAQFIVWADPTQDKIDFANTPKTQEDGAVTLDGDASFSLDSVKAASGSKTVITAPGTEPEGRQVLVTNSNPSDFKLALLNTSDGTMGIVDRSSAPTITIDANGKSPHFHLYPAFSPDSTNTGMGPNWAWPKASDGRFYGWYVLEEVVAPQGFMVPHDVTGTKIYPRFLVAADAATMSAKDTLNTPDTITGHNATINVYDEPIGSFDLVKDFNHKAYDTMVNYDDGCPDHQGTDYGTSSTTSRLAGARFNIYADNYQGANAADGEHPNLVTVDEGILYKDSTDGWNGGKSTTSGWKVYAGQKNTKFALIDPYTGQLGKTAIYDADSKNSPESFDDGILEVGTDGHLTTHVHLLGDGAPDMEKVYVKKPWGSKDGYPMVEDLATKIHSAYTTADDTPDTFHGWYVIEEVERPKGFIWPHTPDGQIVYPRFQVTSKSTAKVGFFEGEGGLGNFFDIPIPMVELFKRYKDDYSEMITGEPSPSESAIGGYATKEVECTDCSGTGFTDDGQSVPCEVCGGDGKKEVVNTTYTLDGAEIQFYVDQYQTDTTELKSGLTDGMDDKDQPKEDKTPYGTPNMNLGLVNPDSGRLGKATNASVEGAAPEKNNGIYTFTTKENGTIRTHLLPQGTPDTVFTTDEKLTGVSSSNGESEFKLPRKSGKFEGWYVIAEITPPEGFTWPHNTEGERMYPRFQVKMTDIYEHEAESESVTPRRSIPLTFYNEPLLHIDIDKVNNQQYQAVVRADENGKPTNKNYTLKDAKIRIFPDLDQKSTVEDRPNGMPDYRYAFSMQDQKENIQNKYPYNNYQDVAAYDDDGNLKFITDADGNKVGIELNPEFNEKTIDGMTDALGNPEYYIHRYTTDKNGKFDGYIPCNEGSISGYVNFNPLLGNKGTPEAKQTFDGYYVIDEVIAPVGYLLPHTLSGDESQVQPGQQLYPRFQVTDQRARENDRQQTVTEDPARVFFTVMKVDPTMLRTDITPESTPGHNGDNIVFDPNTNYPIKQVEGYMAGAVYALTTSNDGEVFYGLTSREGEVTFLSKEFKPFLDMLTEVANVPETAVSSMTQQAQELRNKYLALLKKEYEIPQPTGINTTTPFVEELKALGKEYGYEFDVADVPLGDFTIREVMNPDGYEMSQDVIKSTITDDDLSRSVKDLGDLYLHPNGAVWFKDHQYSNYNRTDISFDNTELYRKETPTSFDFALRKVRPTNYGDTSLYGENEKDENGNIKTLPLKTQLEKLLADLANIDYSKYDATTGEALKTAIEDATNTFNDQQSDDSDYTIAIQDVLAKRNVLKDLEGNKADIADTTTTQVGIPGIKFAIYRLNSDDQLYISGTQDPARSDKMELINGDRVGTIVTGSDGYATTQIHEKASKFTQSNDYEVYDRNGNRVDRNLSEVCPDCGGKGTTGDETPIPCETCQGKGKIQEMVDCTVCSGTGFTDEDKTQTCEACEGTGKVVATEEVDCTTCSGTGFTDEEKQVPCEVCGGDGKVDQPKAATPCADCDGTGNQGSVAAPKCATCNGSGYVANSTIWLGDGIPATDGGGTDDEGNAVDAAAIIGSLPYTEYGYLIRELEDNLPGELKLAADIRVRPSDQSTAHDGDYPAWNMDIYNNPVTVLRFIKTDARTQKTVPAAGFTFELYAADGPEDKNIEGKEPIVQVYQADHPDVVSGKVKAGKAYQWTTDATGSVTMPAPLANGYYIIHEVSTGDTINPPYIITPNVNFKFESNHGLVEVLEAPFANNVAHGHIDFQKVDAETGEPLAGVTFKVKAAEDIYSGDGTIVVAKGSYVACVDDGTGTDLTMVSDENGMVHCCDPAERHENGCLPIDATDGVSEFELVETHAVDGYNIIEPNKAIPFTVTYINDDPANKDLNAVLGTAAAAAVNDAPADTPDTPDVPETDEPGSEDTPVTPDTPETPDTQGDEEVSDTPDSGEDQEQDAQTPAMASETEAGDGVADEGAPEGSGDEDSEDQSKDPADTPEENPDGGSEDAGEGEAEPQPEPEPTPQPETDNIVVVHNPDAVMAATIETADGYAEYRSDDKVSDQNPMGNVVPNEKLRIPVIKGYVGDEAVVLPEASYMVWNADEEMASPEGVSEERYAANIIVSDGAGSVALRPHTGSGGLVTSRYDNQGFISLASETAVEGNYRLGTDQSLAVNPSTYQVMYHPVTVGVDGQVTQGQTQILGDLTVHAGDAVVLSPAEDGTLDVQTTSVEDLPVITLSKPLDGVENTYQVLLARGEYDVLVGGMVVNPESPLVIDKSNVTYWTNSLEVADGTRTPLGRWVRVLLPASANIQVQTTTGEDGVLEFVGLGIWDRITTYHFAEIDPPKGYTIDHAIYTITTNTENEPVLVPESSEASAISADGVAVASNGVMAQVAVDDGTSTVANDAGTLVVQSDLKSAKVLDDKTKVKISKKDMTTSEEIPGARLRLRDKDGNLIEEWYSTTEPHEIEGLKPGKYTLEEVIPPRTHEMAETVTFEVKDDGTIEPVEMFDREIEIDAVIDKRQEIANPIADDTLANGDNAAQAKVQENKEGLYDYSLDYESRSNTYCDEFTVEDDLDMAKKGYAYLEGITTAQGGQDLNGLMNVWYKTNKDDEAIAAGKGASPDSAVNATIDDQAIQTNPWLAPSDYTSTLNEDGSALDNKEVLEWVGDDLRVIDYNGWHVWASNVPTYEATDLKVSDLKLADGEYITGFRFEYGRVEAGFTTREDRWEDPDIKDVHDDVDDVIAENNGSFTVNGVSHNYAPAKIHMRLTKAYDGTKVIQNSARVDAYRNGGHLPSDGENSKYGHSLEGHDSDTVVQMPMPGTPVISGKLDKRQEIADPVADKTEANGDGKNTANTKVSPEGIYKYSLDFINTSDTWVDEFTVTDSLDAVKARLSNLVSITTPMAHDDYDGLVNVWYKLSTANETDAPDSEANQTIDDGHENPGMERQLSYGGWKLWKQGISLDSPETLNVSDLNIPEGDYITDVRFEFGRVEVGFTSRQGDWDRVGLKDVHDDVDNVATENEAGYAPAHITCQVTPAYVEGKPLDNSAVLDIYRTLDGTVLSDHDSDAVTQTPKYVPLIVPQGTPTSDVTSYKMTSLAETGIPGLIIGFGIIGAATGLTYTVRKIQQRRNKE